LKKRRLINGKELVFKKPGDESDEEEVDEAVGHDEVGPPDAAEAAQEAPEETPRVAQEQRITIHEDD